MAPEVPERARKMSKQRTLEQIKSLEPEDDERTGISKKVSWILRHGYQKVNVKMDSDGWVNISDLLEIEILEGVTKETLMAVIVDKNAEKLRYKLKETPEGIYIKAYSKTERKATNTSWAEPEKKTQGLRQEAQPFVPSNAFSQGFPQLGYPWPMAGGFGYPMMQWPGYPMSPFMTEGSWSASPGRHLGRIKSFNAEKGFGFIECAETYAQFNRDVFLHKAQCGDMTVGTEVTFRVETNKQGMPQAKDLAPPGAPGTAGSSGKAGKGKGKGGSGKGGRGQGKGGGKSGRGAKGSSNDLPEPGEKSTEPPAPTGDAATTDESAAKSPEKAATTEAGTAAATGSEPTAGES